MKQAMRWLPIALALALGSAPAAFAQQSNTLQPPPRVAPISPSAPPPLPTGVDTSRDSGSLNKLNRELDASSRRVQADTLRNQIQREDRLIDADRARTDARRAANPSEAARLRQEFETRRAAHDAWRVGKEQQAQRLEVEGLPPPPPPNEVKAPAIEPGR